MGQGVFAELRIIDTDTHLSEPHDLWTSRAPAGYRDRLPHVETRDGVQHWLVDRDVDLGPAIPASVVRRDGGKARGIEFFGWTLEEVHEASYDTAARLRMMDRMGVHAQIVYPNLAGFGNQNFLSVPDVELRNLCATLYNDAMLEIQHTSGERIFPMALMPWWDIETCAREVERAHASGLRGVVMCSDPDSIGMPDLSQPDWEPFWRACNDLRMPVNFHIGASQTSFNMYGRAAWPSMGPEQKLALGSANLYIENARVLGCLLYSGILERFPEVKVVSVESGIGWIPFVLEALDYQMIETVPTELAHLKMLPSEYFRRQVYGCFWFETTAPQKLIETIGVRNVMFETDFPHPTCLYPEGQAHLAKVLADLDPHIRRRVLQDNAAELYCIPVG